MTKQKTSLRGVAIAALAAASLSFPFAALAADQGTQSPSGSTGMQMQNGTQNGTGMARSGMHKKSMSHMAHMKKPKKHHMRMSRRAHAKHHGAGMHRKLYGSTRTPSGNSLHNVAPTLPSHSSGKGTMNNTAPSNSQ